MNESSVRRWSRYACGALYIVAGANHFLRPDLYVRIMPPYLPWHMGLVLLSGAIEMLLGALLLWQRTRRAAAWGLIALLVAIFPANLHMALNPRVFPQVPEALLWLRLPFQPLLILWAYAYTRPQPEPRAAQP